jgi:hypothetical protein
MPFYDRWFCNTYNKFLESTNESEAIKVRSLNMNYSNPNAATLAIRVNGERWLLSLYK